MRIRTIGDLTGGALLWRPRNEIDIGPAVQGLRLAKPSSQKQRRKSKAKLSLKAFCNIYLKNHFTAGFSELHEDIFKACDSPPPKYRGKRVARIAPRKFGKTTIISLALPLHRLCYQTKRFILILGESREVAEGNLSTLTQEIENNELIMRDFPHMRPKRDAKGQLDKWTDRQITLSDGATVMARGLATRMRGIKHGADRPDLAILDDPESPETADTFLKRHRHKRWFGGTFMGLGGSKWDVFVIGNLPHKDCLIADLVKSKRWDGKLWRALNIIRDEETFPIGNTKNDGSPLWPEEWSIERLEAYKKEPNVGALNFAREMMNDPREEEDKPFDPSSFTYFVLTPEIRQSYIAVKTAMDPAGGEKEGEYKKGKRDYCCIVTGGKLPNGNIDIIDVQLTKKTPDGQVDLLLDVYEKWKPEQIGVEENMFKNLIAPSITEKAAKRNLYPNVFTEINTKKKLTRILGTQPQIADPVTRVVRFARHLLEDKPKYFAMYDEMPGDYDDGPDATEQLIKLMEFLSFSGVPTGPTNPSHWRGK
jgi:hypothetical protein